MHRKWEKCVDWDLMKVESHEKRKVRTVTEEHGKDT